MTLKYYLTKQKGYSTNKTRYLLYKTNNYGVLFYAVLEGYRETEKHAGTWFLSKVSDIEEACSRFGYELIMESDSLNKLLLMVRV